ncbi:MAG: hypothetical protein MZV63_11595 [Marinilabiliales bacterium]|nr:hypothetical protein [Marinilabiliales bacterium]
MTPGSGRYTRKNFTWPAGPTASSSTLADNYVFNPRSRRPGPDGEGKGDSPGSVISLTLTCSGSRMLFGYEGDKYYFSMDIRRHFGLDKYDSAVIPYWKTETVEAMTAFRYREHFYHRRR